MPRKEVKTIEAGAQAQVIPDSELYLHTPKAIDQLDQALEWSATHPRRQTDLNSLRRRVVRDK